MNTKLTGGKRSAEHVVKDIRRATRRHFSSENKTRIVLDCLRGEVPVRPGFIGYLGWVGRAL